MMAHNFFWEKYFVEQVRTDSKFWLCDPGGDACAYSTNVAEGEDRRCAVVYNDKRKALFFVPIDKNMNIQKTSGELESTCDGMLYSKVTRELSFVELKEYHTGGGISLALSQLKNTIRLFLSSHNYQDFKNRRAYACNPVRPHFATSYRETSSEFLKQYHFRFLPQADIHFER